MEVRRLNHGKTIPPGKAVDGDYGQYLGEHEGKHVICMLKILYNVHGVAEYDTVEEMRKDWCLD